MTTHGRVYSWTASGLFLGAFLVLWVITATPQPEADAMSYLALGAGLALALASFATFLGLEVRRVRQRPERLADATRAALRQGIECAIFVVGATGLWAVGSTSWVEIAFLGTALVFAELALSFKRREVHA
ncbi:MAG: hypothetical protein ACOYBJ_00530 [Patescibacteria group bacterium]|jgi:hypothetical protein